MLSRNLAVKIRFALDNYPHLRDSDRKLCVFIWRKASIDNPFQAPLSFLELYENESDFPSAESIARARRKIQADNPELRGTKRGARMAHQEVVKDQLKDNSIWPTPTNS